MAEALASYRRAQAIPATPAGSAAWRARDLADWWARARRLALDAGCPLPPVPPEGEVTEREYITFLDELSTWLSAVAPPPAVAPNTASYIAATLRPSLKNRSITPPAYLALVDHLDGLRSTDASLTDGNEVSP